MQIELLLRGFTPHVAVVHIGEWRLVVQAGARQAQVGAGKAADEDEEEDEP